MKEFIKKNFAILLAFLLPILLIVIVALSTYLPSLFISTDYNFIYASCGNGSDYYSQDNCRKYIQKVYSVVDEKLAISDSDYQDLDKNGVADFKQNYNARIFLHNTEKNESREITLSEAKLLTLSGILTSPDGITVSSNYSYNGGGFFLFDGGRSNFGYYLTKGKGKSKLNLINSSDQYYYQNNFQFIGWVLPGRN